MSWKQNVANVLCEIGGKPDCSEPTVLQTVAQWMSKYEDFEKLSIKLPKYVKDKYKEYPEISWDSNKYHVAAAWIFLFAARQKRLDVSRPFVRNSANCQFTIADSELYISPDKGIATPLFIKSVTYPTPKDTDYVLVDNINGWIINVLTGMYPSLQKFFMVYVDSFLSFTNTNSNQWLFDTVSDPQNRDSPLFIPGTSKPSKNSGALTQLPKCQIAISYAVKGRSIMSYFIDACNNKPISSPIRRNILFGMTNLYSCLHYLGFNWGMLHNDLHLGNMLYDEYNNCVVCIDYGRMHFQKQAEAPKGVYPALDSFVQREVKKLQSLQTCKTYKDVMQAAHVHLKSTLKTGEIYPFHVADVITITCNMYLFILATSKPAKRANIKALVDSFFTIHSTDLQLLSQRNFVISVPDPVTILKGYVHAQTYIVTALNKKTDLLPILNIVLEGVFLFALFLSHSNNYNPFQALLADNKLFHVHFQYSRSEERLKNFIEYLLKLDTNIKRNISRGPFLTALLTGAQISEPLSTPMDTSGGGSKEMFSNLSMDIPAPIKRKKKEPTVDELYSYLKKDVELDLNLRPGDFKRVSDKTPAKSKRSSSAAVQQSHIVQQSVKVAGGRRKPKTK
jgi:hypothetical protein